ncbi:MAG: hypothetical protein ABIX46_08810 [Burkholderiaceae bacterium]
MAAYRAGCRPRLRYADDREPHACTPSDAALADLDAYWRAANYVSVGQIFLWDNPLLKRPWTLAGVKPMLLGHWGTRRARTSSRPTSTA